MRCGGMASDSRKWIVRIGLALLVGSLALPTLASAEGRRRNSRRTPRREPVTQVERVAPPTPAESVPTPPPLEPAARAAPQAPTKLSVSAGAPQAPSRNLASLPAPEPPPSAAAVTVKVGGGLILLYANNFAPRYDLLQGKKKHTMDVWRAALVLDAKLARYGLHLDISMRDRGLRGVSANTFLAETYASADLLGAGPRFGTLVLKLGKTFQHFGKFWDNSFYGSVAFRDGLKLDSNWGFSLEGVLPIGEQLGVRYIAQYFVIDGQSFLVGANRDTTTQVQPGTFEPLGARRRDRFVGRVEPFYKFLGSSVVRGAASIDHFQADYPDTQSEAQRRINPRIRDLDNTSPVTRFGLDVTAQLKWVGAWAEWLHQWGRHTHSYPIAPRAANVTSMTEARAGSSYDAANWLLAGANVTYDRFTLQYNYSQGRYMNIAALDVRGSPRLTQREWIHNPSVQVALHPQLRLIFELPSAIRDPIPGLPRPDLTQQPAVGNGERELVERLFIGTLHGKF